MKMVEESPILTAPVPVLSVIERAAPLEVLVQDVKEVLVSVSVPVLLTSATITPPAVLTVVKLQPVTVRTPASTERKAVLTAMVVAVMLDKVSVPAVLVTKDDVSVTPFEPVKVRLFSFVLPLLVRNPPVPLVTVTDKR